MFKVGKVVNYFDKTNVSVVELNNILAVGDNIRVIRKWADAFEQKIEKIKIDYEDVSLARFGQTITLILSERVKKDDELYKI